MLVPLRVRDVMTEAVETVGPEAVVAAAADRLERTGVGSLVVTRDGSPVGIITTGDVVSVVAGHGRPGTTRVADAMTPDPITVDADATVEAAVRLLREQGFEHLPVVDGDRIVGVVSTTDVAYALPRLSTGAGTTAAAAGEVAVEDPPGWEFTRAGPEAGAEGLSVGDTVRFTKRLSAADVEAFAEACGDTNRLHLEEPFARETRFGRRIVHGTLLGGLVGAALARVPGLAIYLALDQRFRDPIDVGETVTAVCEVVEDLGDETYRFSTAVVDSGGARAVEGDAVVIVDDLPGDVAAEPAGAIGQ